MTNDQLTELSAKAIGLRLLDAPTDNGARIIAPECGGGFWNPLQSNDCIVRLIAVLRLHLDAAKKVALTANHDNLIDIEWKPTQTHQEAMTALRLAVTTLAARIGMEMEND